MLELNVKKEKLEDHGKLTLTFNEPEGFDGDEYPVRATVKVTARFNGIAETAAARSLGRHQARRPTSPTRS